VVVCTYIHMYEIRKSLIGERTRDLLFFYYFLITLELSQSKTYLVLETLYKYEYYTGIHISLTGDRGFESPPGYKELGVFTLQFC
jgi:hypothetical protein